jgi:hypothetical protein
MADTPKFEETQRLFRVLSLLQANVSVLLAKATNAEKKEKLAAEINQQLRPIATKYDHPQCKSNEVYNPSTGLCEAVFPPLSQK